MPIYLSESSRERIRHHGEADYPRECCGLLLGLGDTVHDVASAHNVADPNQLDRYEIDPADHLRVHREARADGLQIIGGYHSHPDAEAIPTSIDLRDAWPGFLYLIASIKAGRSVHERCWILDTDAPSHFEELPICANHIHET